VETLHYTDGQQRDDGSRVDREAYVLLATVFSENKAGARRPAPGRPPGWLTGKHGRKWGGIPSTSPRATTRCPGGKHGKLGRRWGGKLPPPSLSTWVEALAP
jgi:hypothetical protein